MQFTRYVLYKADDTPAIVYDQADQPHRVEASTLDELISCVADFEDVGVDDLLRRTLQTGYVKLDAGAHQIKKEVVEVQALDDRDQAQLSGLIREAAINPLPRPGHTSAEEDAMRLIHYFNWLDDASMSDVADLVRNACQPGHHWRRVQLHDGQDCIVVWRGTPGASDELVADLVHVKLETANLDPDEDDR